MSPSGAVELFAGTGTSGHVDGPVLEARFRNPNGICTSLDGDTLFVIEALTSTDRVRVITGLETVSVSRVDPGRPQELQLSSIYPNPFNPVTTVSWSQKAPGAIRVRLYNLLGRKLFDHNAGFYSSGSHSFKLNAITFSTGNYFLVMNSSTGNFASQKLELIK